MRRYAEYCDDTPIRLTFQQPVECLPGKKSMAAICSRNRTISDGAFRRWSLGAGHRAQRRRDRMSCPFSSAIQRIWCLLLSGGTHAMKLLFNPSVPQAEACRWCSLLTFLASADEQRNPESRHRSQRGRLGTGVGDLLPCRPGSVWVTVRSRKPAVRRTAGCRRGRT